MTEVIIDSHIRIPRPKYRLKEEERRRKLFKSYADAHQNAYVIRPTRYTIREDGFMTIYDAHDRVCEVASEKRIELRIKQMRERIKDR